MRFLNLNVILDYNLNINKISDIINTMINFDQIKIFRQIYCLFEYILKFNNKTLVEIKIF